jgi:hypothetical protein
MGYVLGQPLNLSHPLNQGLLAYWLGLPGMAGGQLLDISGRSNHGTLTSFPAWCGGVVGQALQFDGVDDVVTVANETSFDLERTAPFTIAAWMYPIAPRTGGEASYVIFTKSNASNRGWGMTPVWNNAGTTNVTQVRALMINTFPGNVLVRRGTTDLTNNRWWHVAATYDGTSTAAGLLLYVDGAAETVAGTTATLTATILHDNAPTIGGVNATNWFPGAIGDLRVYNRTLSATQIMQLYELSRRGYPGVLNQTTPWWKHLQAPAAAVSIMPVERSVFRRLSGRVFGRVN